MKKTKRTQLFFWISFLLVALILVIMFWPLINTILLGVVFSFIFYPVYHYLFKKTGLCRISAFIVCLLFVLIVTVPMLFTVNRLAIEVFAVGDSLSGISPEGLSSLNCPKGIQACTLIVKMLGNSIVQKSVQDIIAEGSGRLRSYIGDILLKLPNLLVRAFIILFMMYYLFIDGELILGSMKRFLPIDENYKKRIFEKSYSVLSGILYGNILVGLMQGAIAAVGFYIFGVRTPILWGIMVFFFSFVPLLGTAIVWLPLSAFKILNAYYLGDSGALYVAVGLLAYSAVFVGLLDNLVRPKLVSDKVKIHPLLILFGIISGLSLFDAAGIFIGPLLIGIFITLLEIISQNKLYASL